MTRCSAGGDGAFAEYVVLARIEGSCRSPRNLTFEEAAAVPVAALTALQGLRDKGQLQPGQKVLINGASGGVGTFAVQIAKALGAEVTAVCSTRNVDLARSLGADHVVDYTQEDFTRSDGALRPDARCRREQVVVSVQARAQPAGDARHRRRPEGKSSARAAWSRAEGALAAAAQQPEGRLLHREAQQGGHARSPRASRVRKGEAGDRQAVRAERDRRRFRGTWEKATPRGKIVLTLRGRGPP